jgi:hypothetical protein
MQNTIEVEKSSAVTPPWEKVAETPKAPEPKTTPADNGPSQPQPEQEPKAPASAGVVESKKEEVDESKGAKGKVTIQFKYKNYRTIKNSVDPLSKTKVLIPVYARNFRLELDRDNPEEEETYQFLVNSPGFGVSYWLLTEKERNSTAVKKGETLKKLKEMGLLQLNSMLSPEDRREAGISANCNDKWQLIAAIMDSKMLSETKE